MENKLIALCNSLQSLSSQTPLSLAALSDMVRKWSTIVETLRRIFSFSSPVAPHTLSYVAAATQLYRSREDELGCYRKIIDFQHT
jgi:hypothetical protein